MRYLFTRLAFGLLLIGAEAGCGPRGSATSDKPTGIQNDSHEKALADGIAVVREMNEVFETIHDVETAKSAVAKLEPLAAKWRSVNQRLLALGTPTAEQQESLKKQGQSFSTEMESMQGFQKKLNENPAILKTLKPILMRIGRYGRADGSIPVALSLVIDERGGVNKALLKAAAAGDLVVVEREIKSGRDVNAKGPYDRTPLYLAVAEGQLEMAAFLIDKGAAVDVNAGDSEGMTPLFAAAGRDDAEMAELLIRKGADVNARLRSPKSPLNGTTPLDWVEVPEDQSPTVDVLRKHGGKRRSELK